MKKSRGLLDLFIVLLVLLAALAFYFSFVKPIRFSHLIKREGVMRYAEVEILLTPELSWMRETLPAGEESHNVYGELDWKILEKGGRTFDGQEFTWLRAKILIAEESAGLLRYGKYTLVKGGKIFLINDRYFLEGRIFDFRLSDENIQI